jgi:hypothetical protein
MPNRQGHSKNRQRKRTSGERTQRNLDRGPNIGAQTGYWEADRLRKQGKVDKLIRRARSCRTFDGLERVADDARSMGLWDADNGSLKRTIGQCNARLRGRHAPVRYRQGQHTLTVHDNRCVEMPRFSAKALAAEGWQYAGPVE